MPVESNEFVIQGITVDGKLFRPSDWAERLAGVMSSFGGGRLGYSPYCFPIGSENIKCVVVSKELKAIEPMAYTFLLNFARDNELRVRAGREVPREEPKPGVAPRPGAVAVAREEPKAQEETMVRGDSKA